MHRSQFASWSLAISMLTAATLVFSTGAAGQSLNSESGKSAVRSTDSASDEVKSLKDQLALQQKEIEKLQQSLATAHAAVSSPATDKSLPSVGEVASITPVVPRSVANPESAPVSLPATPVSVAADPQKERMTETSPLQLRVGSAYITPVG